MTKLRLFGGLIALVAIMAVGCSNDQTPLQSVTGDVQTGVRAERQGMALAYGDITSATLHVYVSQAPSHEVFLHRVTADWVETTVTWNNFGGAYDAAVANSFTPTAVGWYTIDVTALVQAWAGATYPNYGILLEAGDLNFPRTLINSRENPMNPPYLEICFEGAGCQQVAPLADAYVYELYPDANAGTGALLNIGWYNESDLEKQALIRFEMPTEPVPASLGDTVWYDTNEDGIQDPGEEGIEGVVVRLYTCADVFVAQTMTDANGFYIFPDLVPGDYYVEFFAPEAFVFSPQDQGSDDADDSDADPATGRTICTTLDPGEDDMTWDAGLYMPPPQEGCTLTIGYWKNHAGFGPQPDYLSQFLPIWLGDPMGDESMHVTTVQMAYDILTQKVYGDPSNGITKLYAQLLAAKLNVANGASDEDIADAFDDADEFLADHSYTEWSSLSRSTKRMVNGLKSDFDDYNNGLTGPGHCDIMGDGDMDD